MKKHHALILIIGVVAGVVIGFVVRLWRTRLRIMWWQYKDKRRHRRREREKRRRHDRGEWTPMPMDDEVSSGIVNPNGKGPRP